MLLTPSKYNHLELFLFVVLSHLSLDSAVARYCPFLAPTTPSRNSDENFLGGHPSWECSRTNSLNFGVPMESEASEFQKCLVL
ncbi:hypothetical protein DVH24_036776 [Malus domestica]|uniref:Secreted protein n=1 Tax=Malus domestica TaxID=3750 RepID=A0A498IJV8_MALDO|nr:hypothetical protein DVH24_036776 [Malus domestica]